MLIYVEINSCTTLWLLDISVDSSNYGDGGGAGGFWVGKANSAKLCSGP